MVVEMLLGRANSLTSGKLWRRGSESNRRIKVLQTSPLPLGYRAPESECPPVRTPESITPRRGEGQLRAKLWSGRRELNPRLRPWQGRTLPLSYSRSEDEDIITC